MSRGSSWRESDWKLFRELVPVWRERYLESRNREVVAILNSTKTPTESFWEAKERMDNEAKILHDCFDGHSRSKMPLALLLLLSNGVIHAEDLERFSKELGESTTGALRRIREG